MGTLEIILIVVGVLALIGTIVYGALRRFSRITWIGWQLLIAFGIVLAFGQIKAEGTGGFIVSIAGLTVAAVVPLVLEYFGRRLLVTDRILKPGMGEMVFDRIFGAVTALLALVSFLFVLGGGGFALGETAYRMICDMISKDYWYYNIPVWTDFLKNYVRDFCLVAIYFLVIRAGCRLGILHSLRVLIVFLLTAGGFFGSFLLATRVGFGVSFSQWIGGLFKSLPRMYGAMIGAVIATFVFTLVCFAVAMVLNFFMNMGIRKLRGVTPVGIIDSLLAGVLYGAIFLVLAAGLYAGYSALAGLDLVELLGSLAGGDISHTGAVYTKAMGTFIEYVCSSPLSRMFYLGNLLA